MTNKTRVQSIQTFEFSLPNLHVVLKCIEVPTYMVPSNLKFIFTTHVVQMWGNFNKYVEIQLNYLHKQTCEIKAT